MLLAWPEESQRTGDVPWLAYVPQVHFRASLGCPAGFFGADSCAFAKPQYNAFMVGDTCFFPASPFSDKPCLGNSDELSVMSRRDGMQVSWLNTLSFLLLISHNS